MTSREADLPATPALVCRWRLAHGSLPLAGRHLRALRARRADGHPLPAPLVAWVGQQVEWAFPAAAAEHPGGVLLLTVDTAGRAALAVGPYAPLALADLRSLASRARLAQREARAAGVAPETLWLARDGRLTCADAPEHTPSGSATLVRDLAQAWGIPVACEPLADARNLVDGAPDEAFVVSDEHGIVPASDRAGALSARLEQAYAALLSDRSR